MSGSLPPLSIASSTIGFISFAFTVSTFLRVVWGNLITLGNAPSEVPVILGNLKQELFEERVQIRRARRRALSQIDSKRRSGEGIASFDSGPVIRIMETSVRKLCKDFKNLERPFLRADIQEDDEKHWGDGYTHGGFDGDYGAITLGRRFSWLARKSEALAMMDALERLQVRRISRETTDCMCQVKQMQEDLRALRLIPAPKGGRKAMSDDDDSSDEVDKIRVRRSSKRR